MKKNTAINNNKIYYKRTTKKFSVNKALKIAALILIIFALGTYFTFLYYINYELLDYKELRTGTIIQAYGAGLNADKDHLVFGNNFPGGWSQRSFYLSTTEKSIVRIKTVGNISSMISYSQNDFLLEPNETVRVFVDLNVPEDAILGNYTGKIKVYVLRAR